MDVKKLDSFNNLSDTIGWVFLLELD